MTVHSPVVVSFSHIHPEDISLVGKKAVDLSILLHHGVSLSPGFIVTTASYQLFLEENHLKQKVAHLLETIDWRNPSSVNQVSSHIQKVMKEAKFPEEVAERIIQEYEKSNDLFSDVTVTITASPASEHTPSKFAEIYTRITSEVTGESSLLMKIKESWATFFTARSLLTRHEHMLDHFYLSVALIISKKLASGELGTMTTEDRNETDEQLKQIRETVKQALYFPHAISWTKENGKYFVTDISPLIHTPKLQLNKQVLLKGSLFFPGIVTGVVKVITNVSQVHKVLEGDIVVTLSASDFLTSTFSRAGGLIVEKKETMSSEVMSKAKAYGFPILVGATNATTVLKNDHIYTLHAVRGEVTRGSMIPLPATQTPLEKSASSLKIFLTLSREAHLESLSNSTYNGILLKSPEAISDSSLSSEHQTHLLTEHVSDLATGIQPRPLLYMLSSHLSDSRFMHQELEALRQVREKKHLKNVSIVLPQVHSPSDIYTLKKEVANAGLYRDPTCKLYITIASPISILQIDELLNTGIDGALFDIDSLAHLLTGVNPNDHPSFHLNGTTKSLISLLEKGIAAAKKSHVETLIKMTHLSFYPSIVESITNQAATGICILPTEVKEVQQHINLANSPTF